MTRSTLVLCALLAAAALAVSAAEEEATDEAVQKIELPSVEEVDGVVVDLTHPPPYGHYSCRGMHATHENVVMITYKVYKAALSDEGEEQERELWFTRDRPMLLWIGSGRILPAIETSLIGACAGEGRTVTLAPQHGAAFMVDHKNDHAWSTGMMLRHGEPDKDTLLVFEIEVGQVMKMEEAEEFLLRSVDVEQMPGSPPEGCTDAPKLENGDLVSVHMLGRAMNDKGQQMIIDSTSPDGPPRSFIFNETKMMPGVAMAMKGMCEGEHRVVNIPPTLAFLSPQNKVDRRRMGIDPRQPVNYEIQLVRLEKDREAIPALAAALGADDPLDLDENGLPMVKTNVNPAVYYAAGAGLTVFLGVFMLTVNKLFPKIPDKPVKIKSSSKAKRSKTKAT